MLGGELAQLSSAQMLGHEINCQVVVPGIIHVPVEIHIAVGDLERLRGGDLFRANAPRHGQLISGHDPLDEDIVALGEDDSPGFGVDQDPEGDGLEQNEPLGVHDAKISGEIQVHGPSRPGEESDFLVVLRQAVDDGAVLRHGPQKSLVQCLLAGNTEVDRVRDRGFLEPCKQCGEAQRAPQVHVRRENLKILSVNRHENSFLLCKGIQGPQRGPLCGGRIRTSCLCVYQKHLPHRRR